jgi:DMSO/TMAO reductase YedYZ molybdopterin-dependent catalytic subunit
MPPFCAEDATGHRFWEGKGTSSSGDWSHVEEGVWTVQRGGARPIAIGDND